MLFTSLQYLLFLPLVVALYWLVPCRWRLMLLLVASYYFYASWIPAFTLLILGLTVFNFWLGGVLFKASHNRKSLLAAGIAGNLICLCFFKYTNFILSAVSAAAGLATPSRPDWHVDIILPLGISFFVFEFIHYLVEVYRGGEPIRSFVLFALFAAFFPTQIAGPIKRYADFQAQMLKTKKISLRYFDEGLPLIIQGMAKKLLIANNLAVLVHMGYTEPRAFGAPELWLFAYAFAFQIYFDFSGYTDIARGSAMLFGYHIPINFNLPYCAQNISDFWHRWHISLSTWLKDYLFIPLGGSRAGRCLTYRNLMITMALGGLWHGASFNFLFWGVYHGLALVVHREFVRLKSGIDFLSRFFSSPAGRFLSIVFTFHAVCIGWVFFRVHDLGTALHIVKRMLLLSPIRTKVEGSTFLVLQTHLPVVVQIATVTTVALLLFTFLIGEAQRRNLAAKAPVPLKSFCLALLLFALVVLLPDGKEPFIYFQF